MSPQLFAAQVSKAKINIAGCLTHPAIGNLISKIYAGRVPCGSGTLCVDRNVIPPQTTAAVFWRLLERAELRMVRRTMRNDLDVIELGSGIGIVSLAILKAMSPLNRMLCVEANSAIVPMLTASLRLNGTRRQINVVNAAIDYGGHRQVNLFVTHSHLGSLVVDQPVPQSLPVDAVTLHELHQGFDIQDYVLVCDIEGAEIGIFLKDEVALTRCRQMIVELHDTLFEGQAYTANDMYLLVTKKLGFSTIARRHNVFVFERQARSIRS